MKFKRWALTTFTLLMTLMLALPVLAQDSTTGSGETPTGVTILILLAGIIALILLFFTTRESTGNDTD